MARKNAGSPGSASVTLWLGIALIVVLFDQISKITMSRLLAFGQSEPVTSFFNLVMVYNKGAAFSFLADQQGWQRYLFAGISLAASLLIIWMLKHKTVAVRALGARRSLARSQRLGVPHVACLAIDRDHTELVDAGELRDMRHHQRVLLPDRLLPHRQLHHPNGNFPRSLERVHFFGSFFC